MACVVTMTMMLEFLCRAIQMKQITMIASRKQVNFPKSFIMWGGMSFKGHGEVAIIKWTILNKSYPTKYGTKMTVNIKPLILILTFLKIQNKITTNKILKKDYTNKYKWTNSQGSNKNINKSYGYWNYLHKCKPQSSRYIYRQRSYQYCYMDALLGC